MDLFKHYTHSERMEKFILMLGTKVDLSEHTGYFGGLHAFEQEIEENGDADKIKVVNIPCTLNMIRRV